MALRYGDAIDDGVTETVVCSLEPPAQTDNLTAAEKAALRFGDLDATDHRAIEDSTVDALRLYFDEGQIAASGSDVSRRSSAWSRMSPSASASLRPAPTSRGPATRWS